MADDDGATRPRRGRAGNRTSHRAGPRTVRGVDRRAVRGRAPRADRRVVGRDGLQLDDARVAGRATNFAAPSRDARMVLNAPSSERCGLPLFVCRRDPGRRPSGEFPRRSPASAVFVGPPHGSTYDEAAAGALKWGMAPACALAAVTKTGMDHVVVCTSRPSGTRPRRARRTASPRRRRDSRPRKNHVRALAPTKYPRWRSRGVAATRAHEKTTFAQPRRRRDASETYPRTRPWRAQVPTAEYQSARNGPRRV